MSREVTDWMNIAQCFYWSNERLLQFSQQFSAEIERVLAGQPSSLQAVKSYLALPTGREQGTYLALDFGGTNVRVSRIRLLGHHCFIVEKKISRPLKKDGEYNYMTAQTTADELFDFIADLVGEAAGGNKPFYLGHTFSFGVAQHDVGDARFLQWSKEITVAGAEGRMVNDMLRQALVRKGLDDIIPVALLNDTTALLLAAGYQHGQSQVGIICGTGFNMCYYEPRWDMIVSLEAGGYDGMARTNWDIAVDEASQQPGYHQLEKMVSGAYLSEIYRRVAMEYLEAESMPPFTTEAMNHIVANDSLAEGRLLMGRVWKRIVALQDVKPLRSIGAAVFVRSAQLTGASCFGVLRHLYPDGAIPTQTIAVEGSVLEHVRGSLFMLEDALHICQAGFARGKKIEASPVLVKDGPSVGAAIAAAMAAHH